MAALAPVHNPANLALYYLGPEVSNDEKYRANARCYGDAQVPAYVPPQYVYNNGTMRCMSEKVDSWMRKPIVTLEMIADESHRMLVRDKFEANIANFFSQILLVYKTGIQFIFHNSADSQIGKPPIASGNLPHWEQWDANGFECAHIASLPSLRAYIPGREGRSIAFGRGSFFQDYANATIWLPKVVNDADSELDIHSRVREDSDSFRFYATRILNGVSLGWYDPKQALIYYLNRAVAHLTCMMEKPLVLERKERKIILSDYLCVTNSYLNKIWWNNYVIKALCCEFNEHDDESTYMSVQQRMHHLFISNMNELRPKIVDIQSLQMNLSYPGQNPSRFINYLNTTLVWNRHLLNFTPTVYHYINTSLNSQNVRIEGLNHLVFLPDETALMNDLRIIFDIKQKVTAARLSMSDRLRALYNSVLDAIKHCTEEPRNMSTIMFTVVLNLSYDPCIYRQQRNIIN